MGLELGWYAPRRGVRRTLAPEPRDRIGGEPTDTAQLVGANTTATDRLLARGVRPWRLLAGARKYRRAFRNWREVLTAVRSPSRLPIRARLRGGGTVDIDGEEACFAYALDRGEPSLSHHFELVSCAQGVLEVRTRGRREPQVYRIRGMRGNGDPSVFFDPVYANLPVAGRTVVDIGANIGDSAIMFAANGAARVLAVEPLAENLRIAEVNVRENGLGAVVRLEGAALGATPGKIRLAAGSGTRTVAQESGPVGNEVAVATLEEVARDAEADRAILKMDCEGAEYEVLDSASVATLQRFDRILIEYHYGHRSLTRKLRAAGFRTELRPSSIPSWKPGMGGYVGYLEGVRE